MVGSELVERNIETILQLDGVPDKYLAVYCSVSRLQSEKMILKSYGPLGGSGNVPGLLLTVLN